MGYDILVSKSGICLAAKAKFSIVNVTQSMHPNIISAVLRVGSKHMCITSAYGLQESENVDDRVTFYMELAAEIDSSLSRFSYSAVVGDLNAKLSLSNGQITADSPNGVLLKEVVAKYDLAVMNFDNKCSGKWTRVQKKKTGDEKSVIDYIMACQNLSPLIQEIVIDEDKLMAPFWVRKSKTKETRQHSDHNVIYMKACLPWSSESYHLVDGGDCNKTGHKITEDGLEAFTRLSEGMEIDPDLQYPDFHRQVTEMMDEVFPKKKPFKPKNCNVNKENLITRKQLLPVLKVLIPFTKRGKVEKIAAKKYISILHDIQSTAVQNMKSARVFKTLSQLNNENGELSINGFWKLKKSLSHPDRSRSSVISKEGIELFGGPSILKEYEKEFSDRLSRKPLHPKFSQYGTQTNTLFERYLDTASSTRSEPDFDSTETAKAASTLKSRCAIPETSLPSEVYKFGSANLISNLTIVLNQIKTRLRLPDSWVNVVIATIYKNKGSRKCLEFYRGIFLTIIASKLLEKLIKGRIDPQLVKVNKLQSGSKKNRGPCDSLFLLNGMIDHAKYLNTELFITFYDYSTCFDSLWLEESMIVLWDLGIRNELFSLIFLLNESSSIKVKSPHGTTESFECPRIVKQGTVLGPTLCSSSTAELCDRNHSGGVLAGSTVINDIMFVDDTTDVNTDIVDHVESHNEVVNFSWSKGLSLNHSKCGQMILNQKSTTPTPTLPIGDGEVSKVRTSKVLGDYVNDHGTNVDMIDDRVRKGIGTVVSSLSICNEVTMGMSFVSVALVMHNAVVLATMIFNSQSWSNLSQKDVRRLEVVQLRYLKRIVRAPSSTCNAFVFLELGILPVKFHIHIRKLTFLHHILHLEDSDPVKVMHRSQLQFPYEKNWSNEINKLLALYGLDSGRVSDVSKDAWKAYVKKAVTKRAFSYLNNTCITKSKTKMAAYNELKCQSYLVEHSWKTASTLFKLRGGVADCLANRKSSVNNMACRLCGLEKETQAHVINCSMVSQGPPIDINCIYGCSESFNGQVMETVSRYDLFVELLNTKGEVEL